MSNQYGYRCPNCYSQDHLEVTVITTALLLEDGTDVHGDQEFDSTSSVYCRRCWWNGFVRDLSLGCWPDNPEEDAPDALWFPSQGWAIFDLDDEGLLVVQRIDEATDITDDEARERAIAYGLEFDDAENPYKLTGKKGWRMQA